MVSFTASTPSPLQCFSNVNSSSDASEWPFGFGSKELSHGALRLAQRWGFRAIEKKCLKFSQELGIPLSRPTGKSAMRHMQKARKANKKALKRKQEAEEAQQQQGVLSPRKVKRPWPVVARTFNSREVTGKSQAEYDFSMQDIVDAEDEKVQNLLAGKTKARKGKKRVKVADADGYYSCPIELIRLLDE